MNHAPADTVPTATTPAALLAAILPRSRHALTWAALLCGPGTVKSITRTENLPRATVQREITAAMERCSTLLRPQVAAQYAAADLVPAHRLSLTGEDPRDLDHADRALLRLLARHSRADVAVELDVAQGTVRTRAARVRRFLEVGTDHEATAVGAAMGVVRPADAHPGLPLPAPTFPESLAPVVEAILAALAGTSRAAAQVPRAEQQAVAAAVALSRAGHGARVLVIAADGPAWDSAMDTWTRAREHVGTVVGLRPRPGGRTAAAPGDEQWPLAWTRRGLLDLAGTRQPATVVATPTVLGLLADLHRTPAARPLAPWDLVVTTDAQLRGHPVPGTPDERALPAASRLALTSTRPERLPRDAGPVVVRRCAALAAEQGRVRGHRLLAVPLTAGAGTPDDAAALVLRAARRHGLGRVQVVCGSERSSCLLAGALARAAEALPGWRRPASLWSEAIAADTGVEARAAVVRRFAEGREELLVLTASGPVRAAGADALLVLAPYDEHKAGEAVEWALEARGRHDRARTLTVVVPTASADAAGPGGGDAAMLLRACAVLDPGLADRAERHPAGSRWPWIEGTPYLDASQRAHLDAAARALTTGRRP
ncbi:hypothetical protein ACFVZ3_12320 [Kitasatospora purpeofusca]|uniref:hypothetical protein n=1 Tax=Kitasatospora purpeofusca TaxID=67352 RepID=UPI0036C4F1CD